MPDSIFHESMRWEITCSVLFCLFIVFCFFSYLFADCFSLRGDTSVFLRIKEMNSVLSL